MDAGGGKLTDALGTRHGFTVIMVFWSLACASHSLATSFTMLATSRLLLGIGEGGGFPAASRAVAEWFSTGERATAMGIINGGTAVGGVIAPPLIAVILSQASWRWIFCVTGGGGVVSGRLWGGLRFWPGQGAGLRGRYHGEAPDVRVTRAPCDEV